MQSEASNFDGKRVFVTDAACFSSLVALSQAVLQLRAGRIDETIVGGAFLSLSPDSFPGFSRIGALSHSEACRPYDGRADGFLIGAGVGAVVLRREEDAQRAGDRIYPVIKGITTNNDCRGEGPMPPRREGRVQVLEEARADSLINPCNIGFIGGHGRHYGSQIPV